MRSGKPWLKTIDGTFEVTSAGASVTFDPFEARVFIDTLLRYEAGAYVGTWDHTLFRIEHP